MKRLAALLVLTAALMVGVSAPAQAEECLTVPDLPGECLTPAVHNYIVGLQTTVFLQTEQTAHYFQKSEGLWADKIALQQQVAADAVLLKQTVDAAKVKESALLARIVVLRAKVKELKQIIRG